MLVVYEAQGFKHVVVDRLIQAKCLDLLEKEFEAESTMDRRYQQLLCCDFSDCVDVLNCIGHQGTASPKDSNVLWVILRQDFGKEFLDGLRGEMEISESGICDDA